MKRLATVLLALVMSTSGCAATAPTPPSEASSSPSRDDSMIAPEQHTVLSGKGAQPDGLTEVNGVLDCDPQSMTKIVVTKNVDGSFVTDGDQRITQLHWAAAPGDEIVLGLSHKTHASVWSYVAGAGYVQGAVVGMFSAMPIGIDTPVLVLRIAVRQGAQTPTELHLCRLNGR